MRAAPRSSGGFAYVYLLAVLALAAILWLSHAAILTAIGMYLNAGGPPQKADAIVVLAGGWGGERIIKAGQLVRAGYAPYALVSGPKVMYGESECTLAIPYAQKRGFPAEYFQCVPNVALNSADEAATLIEELKRRNVRSFLVVSVDTHLRRCSWIYKPLLPPGMEVHFVSAASGSYKLERWWDTREGRKAVVMEWSKVLTAPFGI